MSAPGRWPPVRGRFQGRADQGQPRHVAGSLRAFSDMSQVFHRARTEPIRKLRRTRTPTEACEAVAPVARSPARIDGLRCSEPRTFRAAMLEHRLPIAVGEFSRDTSESAGQPA